MTPDAVQEKEKNMKKETESSGNVPSLPGKSRMSARFYPVFWLLSLTWGAIPTVFGALLFFALVLAGKKPRRIGPMFYIRFGKNWGGTELGMFFLRDDTSTDRITYHEAGHGIQNIILGPFMLPIVSIPSFLRYHYRNFLRRRHPERQLPPYDSIWFEGQATRLGSYFFKPES